MFLVANTNIKSQEYWITIFNKNLFNLPIFLYSYWSIGEKNTDIFHMYCIVLEKYEFPVSLGLDIIFSIMSFK